MSHFFSIRVFKESLVDIESGFIILPWGREEYSIWSKLLKDDGLLILPLDTPTNLFSCNVKGKGVLDGLYRKEGSDKILIIYIDSISFTHSLSTQLLNLELFSQSKEISSSEYKNIEKLCLSRIHSNSGKSNIDVFPITLPNNYKLDVVRTKKDLKTIKSIASKHPFGFKSQDLSLVLKRFGKIVAGTNLRLFHDRRLKHRAENQVLGTNRDLLKERSLHVSRLFSTKKLAEKQREFYYLLHGILSYSWISFPYTTSYVSGISYQLIPAANMTGFRVILPDSSDGSFYYYKPLGTEREPFQAQNWKGIKKKYRKIVAERRKNNSWVIISAKENITFAEVENLWALSSRSRYKNEWKNIKVDDDIFILDTNLTLHLKAKVAKKSHINLSAFPNYDLGIYFKNTEVLNVELSHKLRDLLRWQKITPQNHISKLKYEASSLLKILIEKKEREGKMWVEPNPLLLNRTDFEVNRNEIFVIQSWSLKDSILPFIRTIGEENGFKITHSEDQDDQVVFESIWKLLNEAEAIIVDFTEQRPNVYLEYGMALVLGKPIIAITQDESDIPSDTPHLKYLKYSGNGAQALKDLKENLPRQIKQTITSVQSMSRKPR